MRGQVGKATHVKDAGVFVVKSGPTVVESSVPVEGAPYKPKAERTRFRPQDRGALRRVANRNSVSDRLGRQRLNFVSNC